MFQFSCRRLLWNEYLTHKQSLCHPPPEYLFPWRTTKGYYSGKNRAQSTNMYRLYSFCLVLSSFFFFFIFDDVYLLVSLVMCESALNVSVEVRIRGQIVVTELSTCLSTGWIPAFLIDLSWAKSTAMLVHPRARCLRLQFPNTINNMRIPAESWMSSSEIDVLYCFCNATIDLRLETDACPTVNGESPLLWWPTTLKSQ